MARYWRCPEHPDGASFAKDEEHPDRCDVIIGWRCSTCDMPNPQTARVLGMTIHAGYCGGYVDPVPCGLRLELVDERRGGQ